MQTIETVRTSQATWTLDADHSEVGFAVRHLMVATVRGTFRKLSGQVVLDEADLARSSIEADIDAASIDTRQDQRDGHLRSADFLDVENFPVIAFRSTRIEQLRHGHYRVTGDLTVRGTTRPVVLDVEETGRGGDPWGNRRIGYSARTTINREEFGLKWNQVLETGGVMVGNDIKVTMDVQIVRA